MLIKLKFLISTLFALLASWIVFAAIPFFQLKGLYPQVDSQIIFLHGLCGLMSIYLAFKIIFNQFDIKKLDHPLILIPFPLPILIISPKFFTLVFKAFSKAMTVSLTNVKSLTALVFPMFIFL